MLGANIRKHRKKMGLSQAELAEELNVTQASITSWERAKRKPDIDMLAQIALFFHVSVDRLLNSEEGDDNDTATGALPVSEPINGGMTPVLEARIREIAVEVMQKYGHIGTDTDEGSQSGST